MINSNDRRTILPGLNSLALGMVVMALMFATPLWSQTGTSTIRGTVSDAQARVVPDAKVTLTNLSTNAARSTKTTGTGEFTFDLITPGQYRLEVEATGFKKQVVENVRALVGKQTENNVRLDVGATGEVIEVVASSNEILVNTQDATLGNNFISEQISQLPLEARDLTGLLSLQPAVTRQGYVAGARADQSNVTLDGVDINNAESANSEIPLATNNLVIGELSSSITSGPVLRLNAEAIDEFRVTTANANSNQGRSSGAQVNLVTKSGTNRLHGSLFEFHRNTIFTANDWFNNHSGVERPSLIRNTYGGSVGGPIVKDKAFFFYSYESRHDAKTTGVTRVVPLPTLGQGIIKYKYCTDPTCSSTQVAQLDAAQNAAAFSSVGLNPAALSALTGAAANYPANDPTQGDQLNTGGFRFNAPTPVRLNSHVAKLDFNLTNKQNAFVRTNVIYDHATREKWLPDAPSPVTWSHPVGLAVGHTWTIGNNWVNNFRYGFTRQAYTIGGDSDQNDIRFRFVFQPRAFSRTTSRTAPLHNFTDDVSLTKGSHNIQFGTNIRAIRNSRTGFAVAFDQAIANPSFYSASGAVTSNAFQNYLTANGLPGANDGLASVSEVQNAATAIIGRFSQYTANFTFNNDGTLEPFGTPTRRTFATEEYDFYVQDTWKVRHDLTLTLGLRYGLARPVYETHGFEVQPTVPLGKYFEQRVAAAGSGENFIEPIVINRSGPVNGGKPMYNWDKNNFQPRIAFAWAPHGGKSVLRGGFAMTNDYYGQALAVNFDLNNTLGFTSNFTTPANTFNITSRPAPLFSGFGQTVQTLPLVVVPGSLIFPLQQPSDYGVPSSPPWIRT